VTGVEAPLAGPVAPSTHSTAWQSGLHSAMRGWLTSLPSAGDFVNRLGRRSGEKPDSPRPTGVASHWSTPVAVPVVGRDYPVGVLVARCSSRTPLNSSRTAARRASPHTLAHAPRHRGAVARDEEPLP
jgi:hypothetical protein